MELRLRLGLGLGLEQGLEQGLGLGLGLDRCDLFKHGEPGRCKRRGDDVSAV